MCFFAFYIYVVLKWAIEQFGMTVKFWLADRNQMIMNGYQKKKQKKARAKRMEVNCKNVIETIAPQQESHDVTEPIGPLSLHYEGISGLLKTQRPYIQYAFEKGLFTNESQEIIKQYLGFNLNENHDDDESDCINADDINDDDQDAHTSIDGDAEDSDEKDSQNSNNINNNIIHNKNAIRLYSIVINEK